MATNARKDLAKALRTAFGVENGSSNNNNSRDAASGGSSSNTPFEDYEAPASLLEAIDEWANSSSIQSGTTERDIAKLRETLSEHCFEQGIIGSAIDDSSGSKERTTQAKSAFIVILDRFSSLDSEVVTVKEIRETWWNKLILPALTLQENPPSETIRISRTALKAARDMAIRALNASSSRSNGNSDHAGAADGIDKDKEAVVKWRTSVFKACIAAQQDSFAQRNLQQILVAYGKTHPTDFFESISDLLDTPVETLFLLNNFIRIHPVQAYQAFQTPLFSKIVAMLDELPVPTGSSISLHAGSKDNNNDKTEDTGHQLLWVSSALCTLNMLMPRLPTSLDKLLDRFFIILARCLLWYDSISSTVSANPARHELVTSIDPSSPDLSASAVAPALQVAPILPALLDFFTQLYGLFPVNLIAFLSSPVKWLQTYYKRIRKRRNRVASTINLSSMGRDALLRPLASSSSGNNYTSSSTSADEGASGTDFPLSGVEEGDEGAAAALRRRRASKSGGGRKGQRSKTNKAKRDMAARAKKEKETAKQKERERRRRSANLLQTSTAVATDGESENQSDVPFPASGTSVEVAAPSVSQNENTAEPTTASTASEARTPKVRIEEPNTPTEANTHSNAEAERSDAYGSDDQDPYTSDDESTKDLDDEFNVLHMEDENSDLDWDRLKILSKPYLAQHVLAPSLLESTEAEFAYNKNRFKKLEAPDLVDEITRTRILPSSSSSGSHTASTSQSQDQAFSPSMTSPPPSALTGSTSALGLSVDTLAIDRHVLMIQNQLVFETYQKNQLAQRLGSLLRDRIATSGAEADKQNLMHQIRSLKSQLSHSQEKLEQLRHESAFSRERLNKYASDQSGRVEKLRAEKQGLNSENTSLKSELADLKASLAALSEELAESKKECFELKSEQEYAAAAQLQQQQEQEHQQQSQHQEAGQPQQQQQQQDSTTTTQ